MRRWSWLGLVAAAGGAVFWLGVLYGRSAIEPAAPSQALQVDTKGVTASIQYEAPLAGFLEELNGKYKLRVTEIRIAPGGYVGDHNHLGPGIRKMTAGAMDYVMPDKAVVYREGDFFFEAGNVSHRAENKTDAPCTHLLFEILPVDVAGPSLILPRDGVVRQH